MIRPFLARRRAAPHPYRTPSPPLAPRSVRWAWAALVGTWATVLVALMYVVAAVALVACSGSQRAHVIAVGNVVAASTDAAGAALTRSYCAASMLALHRVGTWTGERCVASGPNAGREATPEEQAELERVRAAWRPALDAHEVVAHAHNSLVSVLAAADAIDQNAALLALSHAVAAYTELVRAAAPLGLALPAISGGGQ